MVIIDLLSKRRGKEICLKRWISLEFQEAKWYVVHTYSGHENKVKARILKRWLKQEVWKIYIRKLSCAYRRKS